MKIVSKNEWHFRNIAEIFDNGCEEITIKNKYQKHQKFRKCFSNGCYIKIVIESQNLITVFL
jgi:invasion protein IalB